MKFPYGKFGLACDPRHAQVRMEYKGRTLLGDVSGCYRAEDGAPGTRLVVRHFNGEPWPFDPPALLVDVLERTYEGE